MSTDLKFLELATYVLNVFVSAASIQHHICIFISDLQFISHRYALKQYNILAQDSRLCHVNGFGMALPANMAVHRAYIACPCLCDDTVVNDASLFIGKNAQSACAILEICNVTNYQGLQKWNCILPLQYQTV